MGVGDVGEVGVFVYILVNFLSFFLGIIWLVMRKLWFRFSLFYFLHFTGNSRLRV